MPKLTVQCTPSAHKLPSRLQFQSTHTKIRAALTVLTLSNMPWLQRLGRFAPPLAYSGKSKLFQHFASTHRTSDADTTTIEKSPSPMD